MVIPYSGNLVKNPSANDGLEHWDDISNVTVVAGGVDEGNACFRFEPTASMSQNINISRIPPDVEIRGYFLPSEDVSSASKVKAQIVCILHYADGSKDTHVLPAKSFLWGVFK